MRKFALATVIAAASVGVTGCATYPNRYNDPYYNNGYNNQGYTYDSQGRRIATGAVGGAVAGGVAGAVIPGLSVGEGALAGAVLGGVLGAVVGGHQYYRDTRGYCYYVDQNGRPHYNYNVRC